MGVPTDCVTARRREPDLYSKRDRFSFANSEERREIATRVHKGNATTTSAIGPFGYFGQFGLIIGLASRPPCPSASSVRSRRRARRAVLVSASDAKNGFGRLLDRVAKEGRLAITKHDEPCAMLISIDEYRVLSAAHEATLETLAAESRRAVRAHAGASRPRLPCKRHLR
jgi:prevent-host-death family protein